MKTILTTDKANKPFGYISPDNTYSISANTISSNSVSANTIFSNSVIISDGTSSQFLKADGSLDNNEYIPLSGKTKYYAEPSTPPSSAPLASGVGSIALGDGARALGEDMFVYGLGAGQDATNAAGSNFFGNQAGYNATNASFSNFLGFQAGFGVTGIGGEDFDSNFLGRYAGAGATGASYSNFFGEYAGNNATDAISSNFFGRMAGQDATNAYSSNFLGYGAGRDSINAYHSNFFGIEAGYLATNASFSNFFGFESGKNATGAAHSNFFGYQAGKSFDGNNIGANNIIIGTNISLPDATDNAMNLGGVLFGSGLYSATTGNPSITPNNGRIGINVVNPDHTLHIKGDTNPLRIEGLVSGSTDTDFLTTDVNGVIHYRNDVVTDNIELNGLSIGNSQTFTTGTTGTDFNIVSSGNTHTFNIPNASATNRGLISTGTQTFNGLKTFNNQVIIDVPSSASTRESLMKFSVSDAGNDAFYIGNGTIIDGRFSSVLASYIDSNNTSYAQAFWGLTNAANDASDSSSFGLTHIAGMRSSSPTDPANGTLTSVINRKIFTVGGAGTSIYLTVAASGNVGIGTTTPSFLLHLAATTPVINLDTLGGGGFLMRHSNGTLAAPTATQINNQLFTLGARGHDGSGYSSGTRALIGMYASQNFTSVNQGTYITFETTPNNSTTRVERVRIDNAGNVGIGTTNPISKLEINQSGIIPSDNLYSSDILNIIGDTNSATGLNIISGGNNALHRGVFKATRYRGSASSPTTVLNGDQTFSLLGGGFNGTSGLSTAGINMVVDKNITGNTLPQAITFETTTGNTRLERMRITSDGNIGVGTSNPANKLHISLDNTQPSTGFFEPTDALYLTSNSQTTFRMFAATSVASNSVAFGGVRTRGTVAVPTIVQSGDTLLNIFAQASDGTTARKTAAQIRFSVDGTPAANDMPGRITFLTTLDGTTTPLERMSIDNAGRVGIGTTTPLAPIQLRATRATIAFESSSLTGNIPFTDTASIGAWASTSYIGAINQSSQANGGLTFQGFTNSASVNGFALAGHVGSTTPTASAIALQGWKSNGTTGRAAMTGSEKLLEIIPGNNTAVFTLTAVGSLGLGPTTPTARVHIAASTQTAGQGQLKLIGGGDRQSVAENGTINNIGGNLEFVDNSIVYTLAKTLTTTTTLDFPNTNGGSQSDLTVSLTGATVGDVVMLGVPVGSASDGVFFAFVSSADTVTVRFLNHKGTAIDPASGTFRVSIIKY
jgi:hypothetical protein